MSKTLEWSQVLETALTSPGNLYDTYSRFHDYSLGNMMLFRSQGVYEPVASYQTWKRLGRHVQRGQRAHDVIVPVMTNETVPDEADEAKRVRIARLIGFKVIPAVFGYSQTTGPEIPPRLTPGWEPDRALEKLGIREVAFDQTNGNLQGYSVGVEFALNPMAVNTTKTRFHEMGHIVLGHTVTHHYEEYQTHRGVMEFQAEAAAYLVMNELGVLDERTAEISRGYINHWLGEEQPPDRAIQQVFTAADRILKAGRDAPNSNE
jgi:antirestriction factor ArdC-like protein